MRDGLRGKVAVVTGSTSGIGLGIARAFAAESADVLLNGLGDPTEVTNLKKTLSATYGVRIAYSNADLFNPTAIAAMVVQANHELGRVDILVNNAGIQHTLAIPTRS